MPQALKILLVDDSRVARLTLKHLIKECGQEVEIQEAANADEALDLVKEHTFDKALIDYNMPGRDGIELASEIQKIQPDLALVLVTANVQDAIQERAAQQGMKFLGKPVTQEQLNQLINS
ncbi:Response regulator receiver domain-containing protein [Marinospirillum celere]|uniref:Response regulator receiver domain-containing protein n=1 Tax=Marinospirillum celere TaxID=1122252 RepID=A0A1I1E7W8_9GAMM|nr:response regulator [Marinospirillum celere]SFB82732.1 Response regulator receiver domain-containing protein [Marinospirillum celere]